MKLSAKYKELFYRLTRRPHFEELVRAIRRDFGINENNPQTPMGSVGQKQFQKIVDRVDAILISTMAGYMYQEIDTLGSATEIYVFLGKDAADKFLDRSTGLTHGVRFFDNLTPSHLSTFRRRYKYGAFIYVPPYISKTILIAIIHEKWSEIKSALKKKNIKNETTKTLLHLRSHSKQDRDKIVFDLYNKSRKELGLKRGDYKEVRVATLLGKQGVTVTPENVKMIVLRYRKLMKGNI